MLYGLINAHLNAKQVYNQSKHQIHQQNNSKRIMPMLYEFEKGLEDVLGWFHS